MTIAVNFNYDVIPVIGSCKDDWGNTRKFDHIKVATFSGQRVYVKVIKDSIKMCEIAKKMEFENGNVVVKFGKNKVNIGTYHQQ